MCQGFLEWLLWQHMFDGFGVLKLSVQCVHPKEKIPGALWELQGFWE
jgi:hypothetical protein